MAAVSSVSILLCNLFRTSPKIASTDATSSHPPITSTGDIVNLVLHRLAREVKVVVVRLQPLLSPPAATPTIDLALLAFSTIPRIATTHSTNTVFPPTFPPTLHTSPHRAPHRATQRPALPPPTQTRPQPHLPRGTEDRDIPPRETPIPPLPNTPGSAPTPIHSLPRGEAPGSKYARIAPNSRHVTPAPATARPIACVKKRGKNSHHADGVGTAGRRVAKIERVSVTSW